MSTLTSMDMPAPTKSSTRRMAPPGGRTTISLGGDEPPAPAPRRAAQPVPSTPTKSAPAEEKTEVAAPPAPLAFCNAKVGLAIASSVAGEILRSETARELQALGVRDLAGYTVPEVTLLPFAAQYLKQQSRCDVIIALGVIAEQGLAGAPTLQATLTGLIQVGLNIEIPVVPAIVFVESVRDAKQIIKHNAPIWAAGAVSLYEMRAGTTLPFDAATNDANLGTPIKRPGSAQSAATASNVTALLTRLRESLKKHGARGIHGLGRKFRIIDDDHSGELDFTEFKKALSEHALDWTEAQMREVFDSFDEDGSRTITYEEFLKGVRGELNPRRAQLVLMAFERIDADKSGFLELDDIVQLYDASQHPDVIAGRKTRSDVFREFLDTFDTGDKDGKVTPEEFMKYYAGVSASIDDDDYFELMMRNAWHISGGEGWCANTTCKRVLVTHNDGRQTVEEVKNDLGIRGDDKEAIIRALQSQGVDVAGVETFGSLDTTTPPTGTRPQTAPSATGAGVAAGPRQRQAPGGRTTIVLG